MVGPDGFYAELTQTLVVQINQEQAETRVRQSLLIIQAMERLMVAGAPALSVWQRIYLPTVFSVGRTDDLDFLHYGPVAREVFGPNIAGLAADEFGDPATLAEFMVALEALLRPSIAPKWGKGFRFMGRRYVPDSDIFTRLVLPNTGRALPCGLDVMAVLGLGRADEILDQVYQEY